MKDIKKFVNEEIEAFLQQNTNTSIVAWGCSEKTKEILSTKAIKINLIIDSNPALWGTKFMGIPVNSFDHVKADINCVLLVWGNHYNEIIASLKKRDFKGQVILAVEEIPRGDYFKITKDYLTSDQTNEQKAALFKRMVTMIEIEPHSYCNRQCWFCPNSFIDRRTTTYYMDRTVLIQLLKDLKRINYNNKIAFTRYSEPFGDPIFYETLALVKSFLPNAKLHANTNADFLNNESLKKAYSNGLRSVYIQVYLGENEVFNFDVVDKKAQKIIRRISDVNVNLKFERKDWIEYSCEYKDMDIRIYARDFRENGINRSKIEVSADKSLRTTPCVLTTRDVYIDYNCNVVPCCNIRSDNPEHKNMILGTLKENSIFDIYFGEKAIALRRSLLNFSKKKATPCDTCTFAEVAKTDLLVDHLDALKSSK